MACNVYILIKRFGVSKRFIQHVVTVTLKRLNFTCVDVSVHCVGEARIKTLNRLFRGKNQVTDVLSFSVEDNLYGKNEEDAGDIFICPAYIKIQAKRFGVSYKEEITRTLIHGVLHLLGYDHVSKRQANTMFSVQESILDFIK